MKRIFSEFVPLPRFRGLRPELLEGAAVVQQVCPLAPVQGIATPYRRCDTDFFRRVCPLAPFQGIATRIHLTSSTSRRHVCPLAPLVAGYCMKPRSNRSNPAAVKATQNPHHDNSGYRVPVLRPFPALGLTTLFRVFHATSGFGDCDLGSLLSLRSRSRFVPLPRFSGL